MRPNSDMLNASPGYANEIVQGLRNKGMTIRQVAEAAGISKARLEYLMAGRRRLPGTESYVEVTLTYPEQFVLEELLRNS